MADDAPVPVASPCGPSSDESEQVVSSRLQYEELILLSQWIDAQSVAEFNDHTQHPAYRQLMSVLAGKALVSHDLDSLVALVVQHVTVIIKQKWISEMFQRIAQKEDTSVFFGGERPMVNGNGPWTFLHLPVNYILDLLLMFSNSDDKGSIYILSDTSAKRTTLAKWLAACDHSNDELLHCQWQHIFNFAVDVRNSGKGLPNEELKVALGNLNSHGRCGGVNTVIFHDGLTTALQNFALTSLRTATTDSAAPAAETSPPGLQGPAPCAEKPEDIEADNEGDKKSAATMDAATDDAPVDEEELVLEDDGARCALPVATVMANWMKQFKVAGKMPQGIEVKKETFQHFDMLACAVKSHISNKFWSENGQVGTKFTWLKDASTVLRLEVSKSRGLKSNFKFIFYGDISPLVEKCSTPVCRLGSTEVCMHQSPDACAIAWMVPYSECEDDVTLDFVAEPFDVKVNVGKTEISVKCLMHYLTPNAKLQAQMADPTSTGPFSLVRACLGTEHSRKPKRSLFNATVFELAKFTPVVHAKASKLVKGKRAEPVSAVAPDQFAHMIDMTR